MSIAWFRFYEELNDFLPPSSRQQPVSCTFNSHPAIKDLIESLGVPHVEIDLILVNGTSVDFKYKLKDGDQVSVYPVFESLDISGVTRLREKPLRDPTFILDVHLGKLSKYLRLLGFDAYYDKSYNDDEIIRISVSEHRTILTHDKGLLKHGRVTRGYWIRSQDPEEQLRELIRKFDLKSSIRSFSRCLECNGLLIDTDKDEIIDKLQPKTKIYYRDFRKCPVCGRIYWEGSHYERMMGFLQRILNS